MNIEFEFISFVQSRSEEKLKSQELQFLLARVEVEVGVEILCASKNLESIFMRSHVSSVLYIALCDDCCVSFIIHLSFRWHLRMKKLHIRIESLPDSTRL